MVHDGDIPVFAGEALTHGQEVGVHPRVVGGVLSGTGMGPWETQTSARGETSALVSVSTVAGRPSIANSTG